MPQTTTPDAIPYPVTGDSIVPIEPWFANLASKVQIAITNLKNHVDTRVTARLTRTTTGQELPAATTTVLFNSIWGASGVTLANGGFRVDAAGLYNISTDIIISRPSVTDRDFAIQVNGSTIFSTRGGSNRDGVILLFRVSYNYPLAANDVVTFTSVGSQTGEFIVGSSASIARIGA